LITDSLRPVDPRGAQRRGNNALDAMRAAELAHVGSGVAHLAASWKVWTVANNLASALSETAAALSTEAQIQQTKASFERRKQEWELSRNLAAKDADLAAAQVDNATLQHTIALQDKAVAVQHADYAATVAEFLATKFTNADLYRWMSGVLGRAYAYLLQQATAVARLAQAQLAFERQEPLTAIAAGDYWRVGGGTAGGQQPDRGGMTGSVRLLADLVRLDQHAFETDRRKLHLSQTFALSELAADELQRFRDTGGSQWRPPRSCSTAASPATTCGSSRRSRSPSWRWYRRCAACAPRCRPPVSPARWSPAGRSTP